jgi:serine/threonine-protein kinase
MFLSERKSYKDAEAKIDEALRIYRFNSGTKYYNYPTALGVRGLILTYTGRGDEAEQILREAVALRSTAKLDSTWLGAVAKGDLGECLTVRNRFDEAEEFLKTSYDVLVRTQGSQAPRTLRARKRLAQLYQVWKKPELAKNYN